MVAIALRNEALRMLEGKSRILDTAGEVTRILDETGIDGAIIGGVAVVLHGYVRTTLDVDVFVGGSIQDFGRSLENAGFRFDRGERAFVKDGVPVHLVTVAQTGMTPLRMVRKGHVRTVSLADLMAMKLRSGSRNISRAQDLADVVGLIRSRRLTGAFAARLPKDLRTTFRKLVQALGRT